MEGPLVVGDWPAVLARLVESGWARLPEALSPTVVAALIESPRPAWRDLPEEEGGGGVRQQGKRAALTMDDCPHLVKAFAAELVDGLSASAVAQRLPSVPMFNDVTWTYYEDGVGCITAHRDPPTCGGVIATTTLGGTAEFSVLTSDGRSAWLTAAGDVVLLAASGWPSAASRCPLHSVEPPTGGDRMIMTMRFNRRGAGADYF